MSLSDEATPLLLEGASSKRATGQFNFCTLLCTSLIIAIIFFITGILIGLNTAQKTVSENLTASQPIFSSFFSENTDIIREKSDVIPEKSLLQLDAKAQRYLPDITKIVNYNSDLGAGSGYDWLANVTDTFGSRHVGSDSLEKAINYVINGVKNQNFDRAYAEPVPDLKNWIRGEETLSMVEPRFVEMPILGIGGTVGTPDNDSLIAEAIVVQNFDEFQIFAENGTITGKIVVFNEPWLGSYGKTVLYRRIAPQLSEQYGAVAALVRSVTPFSVRSPHTGAGYAKGKIPSACITVEDAEMMWRMQNRGQKIVLRLRMTSHEGKSVTSHNTVFEITGSEFPNEILLLSGHFDSWDVGQGAMDDGGGCAVMWQALTTLKNLGFRSRRTIRAVFWTAEEIDGFFGSKRHFENHKNTGEKFIFVTENDIGVFKPQQLGTVTFRGKNIEIIRSIADTLRNLLKIPINVVKKDSVFGEDIRWWIEEGVPTFSFDHDRQDYYFIFHHTQADTMTVYKPTDLDFTASIYAAYAHVIANLDETFE